MTQSLCIVDYGSGNLRSVEKAFERAIRESNSNMRAVVTSDPDAIAAADRVVLPGVGAFGACMQGLQSLDGAISALEHAVLINARPFMGICVGMQLLAEEGVEFGRHRGLGWIPGCVREIENPAENLTLPHMGWSPVEPADYAVGMPAIAENASFYFAHSFHFEPENKSHVIALSHHGGSIVAAVGRDNIFGVQFHPEKSQAAGIALLSSFLTWTP